MRWYKVSSETGVIANVFAKDEKEVRKKFLAKHPDIKIRVELLHNVIKKRNNSF